ncbi:MAG: phage terminase large subunit [Devosia sp.]|nr:phage terminase large subunit [Devosia sp.]
MTVLVKDGAGLDVEVPHWFDKPEEDWAAYEEFTDFLAKVWDHLGLPAPTLAQNEIAHRLQYGYDTVESVLLSEDERHSLYNNPREDIIRAFRGLGKSYICAAFVIWRLMRNPRDEKVLVVSATGGKATEFVSQVKGILQSMPMVRWLLEGDREHNARRRDESDQFDVVGASLSQSFSVKARGILGQITGSRATLIVGDDIEIPANSKTEAGRQTILNVVRSDFEPITKTEHGKGDQILLGTPQTEESVYNVMVTEMGFRCWCLPVRYPSAEKMKNYSLLTPGRVPVDILAPYLKGLVEKGLLTHGVPTDSRFGHEELIKSEGKGASHFALQMMLDTSLSDAERYPLKTHDLVCFSTNLEKAPRTVQWGLDSNRRNLINDIPNMGFSGDHLLRPLFTDQEWVDYDQLLIYVDPAGRGKDETAWAVLGQVNGMVYLLDVLGEVGDPNTAMHRIAQTVKKYKVREVIVEPNFGQGMWAIAFGPILEKVYPGKCAVKESEWAKGQKEVRIIDTLEPVMTAHRLVINEAILREDVKSDDRSYSLLYQMTHITRDRNCLTHDDRLDAVAGGVGYLIDSMGMDQQKAAAEQKAGEQQELVDAFVEALEGGKPLWNGRTLAVDELGIDDGWDGVWNMRRVSSYD